MKTCLMQLRLEYFIVSSLIFLLPEGVQPANVTINRFEVPDKVFEVPTITSTVTTPAGTTSTTATQTTRAITKGVQPAKVTINRYEGPDTVFEGTKIKLTGTVESTTPESFPMGYSFFIKPVNATSAYKLCNMDFSVCDDTLELKCYCSRKDGNTYYFVIEYKATLELSEATVTANVGGSSRKYPIVIAQTTTTSTTTTEKADRSVNNGSGLSKTDAIVIVVCSVGIIATLD